MSEPRFTTLTPETMTADQKRVADAIQSGPRGAGLRGSFNALLRSPELCDLVQRVGAYVRFGSSIPPRLNEMAIIMAGRKTARTCVTGQVRFLLDNLDGLREFDPDHVERLQTPQQPRPAIGPLVGGPEPRRQACTLAEARPTLCRRPGCGRPFIPRAAGSQQKCCSKRCRIAFHVEAPAGRLPDGQRSRGSVRTG